MPADDPLVAQYCRQLMSLGDVRARKMFGGWGVFLDGLMFALVTQGRLYFKTDDATVARFRDAGGQPFVYLRDGEPIRMSYWQPPETALVDPLRLLDWAWLAVAAARRARAAKPRRRRTQRFSGFAPD